MHKEPANVRMDHKLHVLRALIAIFALIEAAGHLAYLIPSTSAASFPAHASNSTVAGHLGNATTGNVVAARNSSSSSSSARPSFSGGFMQFNMLQFWFAVEVIAYSVIAMVFLLGLRTWYLGANLFNIFNLGIYILSGFVAIPGITSFAFGSRFHFMGGLSTINIIFFTWVAILIIGLVLQKYDPGSELDGLLVTKKQN